MGGHTAVSRVAPTASRSSVDPREGASAGFRSDGTRRKNDVIWRIGEFWLAIGRGRIKKIREIMRKIIHHHNYKLVVDEAQDNYSQMIMNKLNLNILTYIIL